VAVGLGAGGGGGVVTAGVELAGDDRLPDALL
jgi:hypothetical protein